VVLFDMLHHLDRVQAALRGAAREGRLAHAYLFWGPEGVGKTRMAQALAQLILCRAPDPPCGRCLECDRVGRFTHPDLHVIFPSLRGTEGEERRHLEAFAADPFHTLQVPRQATIGIERIRSLKLESSKARVAQGNRAVILRDADRMTPEAAQAALKLIEEPQPGTFLVLTARDPHRLLPTILSRCQRIRFPAQPREFVEGVLRERGVEEGEARLIAGLAGGGLGRALQFAGREALAFRDQALALLAVPLRDAEEAGERVGRSGSAWDVEAVQMAAELLLSWYGDLIAVKFGMPAQNLVHADRIDDLQAAARAADLSEIRRRIAALEEMVLAVEQNVNPLLALQATLLAMNGLVEVDPLF